ncbi:MAG: 3,4-dihydroxy-2-butanone-4-phosphate synthase [Phycisphaerales bacterium]
MPFAPIPKVLEALRKGQMVVLTDDEDRENEGDLVLPVQFVTPEAVTFMLSKALGYLCLCLPEEDCDRLGLVPQAATNTSQRGTAFTVSIDLHPKYGGTTGVSAKERAKCIQMAIDPKFGPHDFVKPGHVNPLRSRNGGVLVRNGQTEGSVDLCRLAGLTPAAAIIEIMKPDGEMARVPDLEKFCAEHGLLMCSVAQIVEYRLARESLVKRLEPKSGRTIKTKFGEFQTYLYQSVTDPLPHVVLWVAPPVSGGALSRSDNATPTLVRMHRRSLLGDIFMDTASSPDGASGDTLHESMRMIQKAGRGAIVYLRTTNAAAAPDALTDLEGAIQTLRSGVVNEDKPDLQARAQAASVMPLREYGVGCQILRDLGLSKLRLITNSDRSLPGIEHFGLEIVERVRTK